MTRSSSSPPISPARLAVLQAVRRGYHTVNALAEALSVTDNAIRLQLAALERDGLLIRRGMLHSGRAGQPAAEYEITERGESALSRAYNPVLAALVNALGDRFDARTLRALFSDAGRRLARGAKPHGNSSLATRAAGCAVLIESLGGSASVHIARGRATLQGAGCPLADAVRAEPATCHIMESLLEHSAGVKAEQRCQHGDRPQCRFELRIP